MKIELNFIWHISPVNNGKVFCECVETLSVNLDATYTKEAAFESCMKEVNWELEERFNNINLTKRGWTITETEVTPPIINVEEYLNKTKKDLIELGYPPEFNSYNCFKETIIVPPAKK